MAQQIGKIAARQIDALKTGFHADGGNLHLRVKGTGSRSWVFRYKIAGKVRELGLGSKNDRSLADARVLAGSMRKAMADCEDPAVGGPRGACILSFTALFSDAQAV